MGLYFLCFIWLLYIWNELICHSFVSSLLRFPWYYFRLGLEKTTSFVDNHHYFFSLSMMKIMPLKRADSNSIIEFYTHPQMVLNSLVILSCITPPAGSIVVLLQSTSLAHPHDRPTSISNRKVHCYRLTVGHWYIKCWYR